MLDSAVQIRENWAGVAEAFCRDSAPPLIHGSFGEPVNKLPVLQSSKAVPTSVYRYYDKNKILIYVGITSTGITRNRQHNFDKAWWKFVASQEIDHYSSRDAARVNEINLINRFRPPFNRQHNPDYKAINAYYLSLVGCGDTQNLPLAERLRLVNRAVELSYQRYDKLANVVEFVAQISDPDIIKALTHDTKMPASVQASGNAHIGHVFRIDSRVVFVRPNPFKWNLNSFVPESATGYLKMSRDGMTCVFKRIVVTFRPDKAVA